MSHLPSQNMIMKDWPEGPPLVSICCITYNQELYIKDALNGFLTQQTSFPFEILIHDDASTDETATIIREYEKEYPALIRPIYQSENQYSKGLQMNSTFNFPRALGQYLALCEGDDYWCDPHKLQEQVTALKAHPEIKIAFHSAFNLYEDQEKTSDVHYKRGPDRSIFAVERVIRERGGFMPTASLMISADMRQEIDRFFRFAKPPSGDYYMQVIAAKAGGALYIDRPMCVHRRRALGSWSRSMDNPQKKFETVSRKIVALGQLNEFTQTHFAREIIYAQRRYLSVYIRNKKNPRHLKEQLYDRFKHLITVADRARFFISSVLRK